MYFFWVRLIQFILRMEALKQRIAELEADLRVRDLHIGKLAEQLKREKERVESEPILLPKRNTPNTDPEKEKLVKLVKKLFSLLEESEQLRLHESHLRQVDSLQKELDSLLVRN
jgi:hypothetical protein